MTRAVLRELRWVAAALVLALLINGLAIAGYRTRWSELYTQIGWTAVVAAVLYGCLLIGRLAANWFQKARGRRGAEPAG